MNIFDRIRKFNLPAGKYAVFGSALLDVWGIREAADLDIIAMPELYDQLKRQGWEEKPANGFMMLANGDASVTTIQERPTDGKYYPDRARLIRDAIIINGLPFVRIEEVIACKKGYNRPKDQADLVAIRQYINARGAENIYSQTKKETKSAGGVVLNTQGQVLVVNQRGTAWSLPKGHIDKGENALSAAKREIYEESGISDLECVRELGIYQRYKISVSGGDDTSEFKTITMFLFKTRQERLQPVDPDNPEARWVDKENVADLLTHKKDKEFFRRIEGEL